jgi:hypothetical protein
MHKTNVISQTIGANLAPIVSVRLIRRMLYSWSPSTVLYATCYKAFLFFVLYHIASTKELPHVYP